MTSAEITVGIQPMLFIGFLSGESAVWGKKNPPDGQKGFIYEDDMVKLCI